MTTVSLRAVLWRSNLPMNRMIPSKRRLLRRKEQERSSQRHRWDEEIASSGERPRRNDIVVKADTMHEDFYTIYSRIAL
jgi:hypothetical protein